MQKNGTAATLDDRLEALKSSVRNLVDMGTERAGQLKSRAKDAKDAIVENSSVAFDRTGAFIKDHPFVAIGIAFGVGYIAVRMLRR